MEKKATKKRPDTKAKPVANLLEEDRRMSKSNDGGKIEAKKEIKESVNEKKLCNTKKIPSQFEENVILL